MAIGRYEGTVVGVAAALTHAWPRLVARVRSETTCSDAIRLDTVAVTVGVGMTAVGDGLIGMPDALFERGRVKTTRNAVPGAAPDRVAVGTAPGVAVGDRRGSA
jgi:hypothetical protein